MRCLNMSNVLKHKGYVGSIETSLEDMVLHGKIECINDLITYEAHSLPELKAAFEEAVDDYLETCAELGRAPDKSMSGTLNVRIGADLHKKAYLASVEMGNSLNDFIKIAVNEKLAGKNEFHIHIESKSELSDGRFTTTNKRSSDFAWTSSLERRTSH